MYTGRAGGGSTLIKFTTHKFLRYRPSYILARIHSLRVTQYLGVTPGKMQICNSYRMIGSAICVIKHEGCGEEYNTAQGEAECMYWS